MEKSEVVDLIKKRLSGFEEIERIVIFGSFFRKQDPGDIDIAIFQHSHENYLTLALRYRKALRELAREMALDILPIRPSSTSSNPMLREIGKGSLIYDR
jgi:predicted nucleotidyltransferase